MTADNMSKWADVAQTFNMMSISSLKELKEIIDVELAKRRQGSYNESQQKTSKLEVVK